jgi:hypothetical protein
VAVDRNLATGSQAIKKLTRTESQRLSREEKKGARYVPREVAIPTHPASTTPTVLSSSNSDPDPNPILPAPANTLDVSSAFRRYRHGNLRIILSRRICLIPLDIE